MKLYTAVEIANLLNLKVSSVCSTISKFKIDPQKYVFSKSTAKGVYTLKQAKWIKEKIEKSKKENNCVN
jgi:hypothetical protein